jgi:FtsH-binding integral membrane protein
MIAYAKTVQEIVGIISREILTPIVTILFALALILFLWGVVELLIYRGEEEKINQAKRHMFWGLVGLFIMVAVNGIVWVLINFVRQF